ncbi:hypothetical protein L596_015143 [Steinernema carpocapsae]|uniref:Uncharacterized protein n=1 Tax=Steinernema carpocapsae TaxID=34508 RepID=A0A4U5NEB5_STECR|nr:hypothetical protein L596_015143 [Steinernema carpocapsae]
MRVFKHVEKTSESSCSRNNVHSNFVHQVNGSLQLHLLTENDDRVGTTITVVEIFFVLQNIQEITNFR